MLDKIARSLTQLLSEAGLDAGRGWPREPAKSEGVYIRLAIDSARQSEAGFARYLGMKKREDGAETEVYGMGCQLGLRLDIYAGAGLEAPAEESEKVLDDIMQALAQHGGLSISSVSCAGAAYDRDTGLFRCPCRIQARAELCFETTEETALFTDFILKGELKR